jgi:peptidoglycan/xylan/chitin deacetylase (PgdA/CDA1 family)
MRTVRNLIPRLLVIGPLLALTVATACGRGQQPGAEPSAVASPSSPSASRTTGPPTPSATATSSTAAPPSRPATTARPTTTPPPFPSSLAGRDLERIPTTRRVVALTFDAGANANGLASILATLAAEHVSATFFLTGDFVTANPQASRQIVAAGHRVANHTVNHPHLTDLSDTQIRAEVVGAEQSIRGIAGASSRPLFRFPFGDRNARTIAAVNAAGFVAVRWTVDTLGWQGTQNGTRDPAFVVDRVIAAATPGEIVLMHVGSHPTDRSTLDADALPGIIGELRQRGYTFVTLDVLL